MFHILHIICGFRFAQNHRPYSCRHLVLDPHSPANYYTTQTLSKFLISYIRTSLSASDVSYWFVSEPKIAPVRAAPGTLLESVPGDRVYPKYLALKGTSVRSAVEHADWQPQK